MRTYRLDGLESLDDLRLHSEDIPQPQRGEVLLKIHAVSLNYRDIALLTGKYPWAVEPGHVPCSDASAEVVGVGADVADYKPGDRVISCFHPRWFGGRPPANAANETYGNGRDGWLTEYKVISAEAVSPIPDSLSWEAASTLPCAALTAWSALSGPTPVRAGQVVLTLGSGGVSVFAAQFAKSFGATVIGTTSSGKKGERLKELGVDHVINYNEITQWGQRVRELTGGMGVDNVVEVGGPGTVNQSLTAVRRGGEVVLVGFLTSENPGIDYFHLKKSGALVRSIGVGDRGQLEDMVRAVARAGIQPVIDTVYPFEDARQAFAHLERGGQFGKLVIRINH